LYVSIGEIIPHSLDPQIEALVHGYYNHNHIAIRPSYNPNSPGSANGEIHSMNSSPSCSRDGASRGQDGKVKTWTKRSVGSGHKQRRGRGVSTNGNKNGALSTSLPLINAHSREVSTWGNVDTAFTSDDDCMSANSSISSLASSVGRRPTGKGSGSSGKLLVERSPHTSGKAVSSKSPDEGSNARGLSGSEKSAGPMLGSAGRKGLQKIQVEFDNSFFGTPIIKTTVISTGTLRARALRINSNYSPHKHGGGGGLSKVSEDSTIRKGSYDGDDSAMPYIDEHYVGRTGRLPLLLNSKRQTLS
jgi:hypothetical protein